jgi:4-amino-4-deoxy-L-arabinose transferase-like glycosyltransferase
LFAWLGIGLALVLATFLRVRRLDYAGFWGDQSSTLTIALTWIKYGQFPLVANKSSIGLMNPPLVEYLQALPLFLVRDILAVSWLTVLLNLGGLIISAWIAYRLFGGRVALLAALLYAVNPWLVYHGRLIWNQTLVPFFSALTLASLLSYFVLNRRAVYLVLSIVGLACLIQIHMTSAVLIAVFAVVFVLGWRELRLWPALVGVGLAALSFVPFLIFEVQTGFPDWAALTEIVRQPSELNPASILLTMDLMQSKWLLPLGPSQPVWEAMRLPWVNTDPIINALMVLGVGYAIVQGVQLLRHRDQAGRLRAFALLILALWVIAPPLFFLRHSHYLQLYYFAYIFPAPMILMAVLADDIFRWSGKIAQSFDLPWLKEGMRAVGSLSFVVLAVIIVWQAGVDLAVQYSEQLAGDNAGDVWQVRHVRQILSTAVRLLAERPGCRMVIVSDGYNWESSQLGLASVWLSPAISQFAKAGEDLAIPQGCTVYLVGFRDRVTRDWLTIHAQPIPNAEIATPLGRVRFFELTAENAQAARREMNAASASCEWENGVRLLAYQSPEQAQVGATLPLTLTWQTDRPSDGQIYHFGHYVMSAGNALVAQYDGAGFDSMSWQAGDIFVTHVSIELPKDLSPGTYNLETGVYAYPQIQDVPLRDGRKRCSLGSVRVNSP